jgi:hypothetical protein
MRCLSASPNPEPRNRCPLYPQELTTLGDHLHEKRLDLELLQKDIAKMLGTEADFVTYWEMYRLEPLIPLILRMPAFLGWVRLPILPQEPGRKHFTGGCCA